MLIDSLRRFILQKEVTKDKYSDKEIKEEDEQLSREKYLSYKTANASV